VNIDDYDWNKWPHELIYQENIVNELPEFNKPPENIYGNQWKTNNDFIFLKLKTLLSSQYRYAIPMAIHPKVDLMSCFVVGYPSKITYEKFKNDYAEIYEKDTEEERRRYYEEIKQIMDGFEKKIVSVGSGKFLDNCDSVVNHYCPTIRGTSGGLFRILSNDDISSPDSTTFFNGLHLGGNNKMKHNLSFLVTDKAFAWEYISKVLSNELEFFKQPLLFPLIKSFLSRALEENPSIVKLKVVEEFLNN